jgi:hypothetical protein
MPDQNHCDCILCSTEIYFQTETRPHATIQCDGCGVELEITTVEPELTLQLSGDDIHWGE